MDNIFTMSKKIELTRAILDQLSVADIEAILQEKKTTQEGVVKPKPLSKWKKYELSVEAKLKKKLHPPTK